MKKFYVNVQGGLGLNIALASFASYIRENGDADGNKDYEFYICSPYFDVFECCRNISGVYKPNELRDMVFDAKADEGTLILHRLYDMDGFVKKHLSYARAWASLMGIPYDGDDESGSQVTSILDPTKVYSGLVPLIENIKKDISEKGYKDYAIMQFTGGQSPLVQVPAKLDKNGKPVPNEADWSKVPYDYQNEPLKRHYPLEKAQKFVQLYHEKNPNTAIILYQLPNEPYPNEEYVLRYTVPYLAYYELAKNAKEIVCIDSSLQHLAAGVCKATVIWAHSRPLSFGYKYNHNIIQKSRTDDLLYFSALGPSGAKVTYIEPEDLIEELEK